MIAPDLPAAVDAVVVGAGPIGDPGCHGLRE